MKAIQLHSYGDTSQLQLRDVPDPQPGPEEVLIRVISTSVNPIDYKLRSGALKDRMPLEFPAILGRDVSGEITAAGSGVTSFAVGDQVMGLVNHSYAELLVAKASDLARIPPGLDALEAGVLPLVLLTGSQLIERGVLPEAGQTVLVTGAAGSVGRTAVYVAIQSGARVIAGVRKKQKEEAAALRADLVVSLDDDAELPQLASFDAIADTVGGPTVAKLLPHWNRAGRFASVVGPSQAATSAGVEVVAVWAQPDPRRLFALASDVAAGRFTIPIAKRFPLAQAALAQEAAEHGAGGKVLLTVRGH